MTNEELAAIGAISVESAYLEMYVDRVIVNLARLSGAEGDAFLGRAMLHAKLTILSKLAELKLAKRSPRRLTEFTKIIANIREQNDKRTTAIHGLWITHTLVFLSQDPPSRLTKAIRQKRNGAPTKELSLHGACRLANDLQQSQKILASFVKRSWPRLLL